MDTKFDRKERGDPHTVFIYCMYCEVKIRNNQAFKANGHHDVCKDEKCMAKYFKSRRAEMNRSKKKQDIDIGWMIGD